MNEGFDLKRSVAYGSLLTLPWIPRGPRRHESNHILSEMEVSTLVAEAPRRQVNIVPGAPFAQISIKARVWDDHGIRPYPQFTEPFTSPLFISFIGYTMFEATCLSTPRAWVFDAPTRSSSGEGFQHDYTNIGFPPTAQHRRAKLQRLSIFQVPAGTKPLDVFLLVMFSPIYKIVDMMNSLFVPWKRKTHKRRSLVFIALHGLVHNHRNQYQADWLDAIAVRIKRMKRSCVNVPFWITGLDQSTL